MLLNSGRPDEALRVLDGALAEDPSNAAAHGLMALCLLDMNEAPRALESAERASGEAPEWAFPRYVHANVLLRMGKAKNALLSAQDAVSLDPEDPDYHALVASCYVGMSRWREGLESAECGLELDPEDDRCTNIRALCLRQLGDVDEAESALRVSLAHDPDNAWTFQNLGFAALQAGRHEEAIGHFRESLRLDPTDDISRTGLATAIKAKVPLFRPLVAWQMFCSRLSARFGLGLILGFWVLAQVVGRTFPEDSPIGTGILITYASFVWLSWAGDALFDVVLLLKSELRDILTRREKVASLGVIACILLALVILGCRLAFGFPGLEWHALAAAFAAIPMGGWANLPNGKARALGATFAGVALGAILMAFAISLYVLHCIGWDIEATGSEAEIAFVREWIQRSATLQSISLITSVASSWILTGLGFVPESRGGKGQRRRPR